MDEGDVPADARSPEGARFVREVMRIVGAERPADLVRMLGGKWIARDQERKVYKWHRGESAPNFEGTVALLTLAGLLTENPAPSVSPRAATLDAIATRMDEALQNQRDQWAAMKQLGVDVHGVATDLTGLASDLASLDAFLRSVLEPPNSEHERRTGGS